MAKRPRKPKAIRELEALDDRWGQVLDWIDSEVAAVYSYKSRAFAQAQFIKNLNKRLDTHVAISDRHRARLEELELIEEKFREAYDAVNVSLDHDAMLEWSIKIAPFVREEMRIDADRRQREYMEKIIERSDRARERDERREARLQAQILRRGK